ncbi:MAG: universal stress protein [Chitinophagaceae bacterium]
MHKIIAALDGLKFSKSTSQYAVELAKKTKSQLIGVFLDDFTYTGYKVYDLLARNGDLISATQEKWDNKDMEARRSAALSFAATCADADVTHDVHHDRNIAIQELLHESIYADLLVIDVRETLSPYPEKVPTEFMRDLLSQAQCPVLTVPHVYKPISKLILLYDGEPSSVHAIKMFSYTLHDLKHLPVEVITVQSDEHSLHVPDNKLMKEFMKRRFPKATYTILKGNPETEITEYLKKQTDCPLVVLGAYHRGRVSRWFRASMADVLMKELTLPLFIAHNK